MYVSQRAGISARKLLDSRMRRGVTASRTTDWTICVVLDTSARPTREAVVGRCVD